MSNSKYNKTEEEWILPFYVPSFQRTKGILTFIMPCGQGYGMKFSQNYPLRLRSIIKVMVSWEKSKERRMKEMTTQRQGYYENGNYFINDAAAIPNRRTRVTVIFHNVENVREQKAAAIKAILADALNAEHELTDVDWDEMAKLRIQTNAGLSSRLDI